LYDLEYKTLYK